LEDPPARSKERSISREWSEVCPQPEASPSRQSGLAGQEKEKGRNKNSMAISSGKVLFAIGKVGKTSQDLPKVYHDLKGRVFRPREKPRSEKRDSFSDVTNPTQEKRIFLFCDYIFDGSPL
jgi:hypothetical protein